MTCMSGTHANEMSMDRTAGNVRLTMQGIGKRFGATLALDEICLTARAGETLALIGENGAGKSTLMKILSGAHVPDAGSMTLDGQRYKPRGPLDARRSGVSMIYQELSLAPDLSVEENMMLGQERSTFGFVNRIKQRELVREALGLLGHSELHPTRIVGSLPVGTQQIVEIARGLVSNAKVMVFDEPTSSLSGHDVQELFRLIHALQKQGIAIVYISHFLEEIREIAKRYTVLRDGRMAGEGLLDDVSNSQIVSLMVGRSVDSLFPRVPHALGEPVLTVSGLSGKRIPNDVSFQLRRGEIVGMFGLVGAGRTETLRLMMGLDRTTRGEIRWKGQSCNFGTRARIRNGLGLVSEDRKGEGLSQSLSIVDNLTLSKLSPYSKFGLLSLGQRRSAASHWMKRLAIKSRSPEQLVSQLSGGNQQKVAIARVLHQGAELLLLDEPTRGIDVGTKAEIYRWIGELAAEGKTVLFVSSYLPELMAVCDTIGVMAKGSLKAIKPTSMWTESDVLSCAVMSDNEPTL
jgi:ribose transport system ATP-binding protein